MMAPGQISQQSFWEINDVSHCRTNLGLGRHTLRLRQLCDAQITQLQNAGGSAEHFR